MNKPLFHPFPDLENQTNFFVTYSTNLPADFEPQLHRHDFYELAWLAKGEATFFSDFKTYSLQAGSLIFIAPGQVHTLDGDWPTLESFVLSFRPAGLTLYGRDPQFLAELPYYAPAALPVLQIDDGMKPFFDNIFTTISNRFVELGQSQEELIFSYLNVLLVEARRLYTATSNQSTMNAAAHLTKAFHLAVDQHYLERKKIHDYADHLGVTPNHLVKTIRQATGLTPGQIVRDRLLLEAKRLLVHTAYSNAEIAQDLAFSSPAQFGHWFKKAVGVSPGQFRQQFHIA